jgi:hypothetical protein
MWAHLQNLRGNIRFSNFAIKRQMLKDGYGLLLPEGFVKREWSGMVVKKSLILLVD